MDSIKKTIRKELPRNLTSPNFSDNNRKPCPHGELVRVDDEGGLLLWECRKCEEESNELLKKKQQQRDKENAFRRTLSNSEISNSIPKRFKNKTIDDYDDKNEKQKTIKDICIRFADNFSKVKENGTSMIFCGKPGTGKTHLAYGIVNALRLNYITAIFRTASDMTTEIKNAYRSDMADVTTTSVTAAYVNYDLLVIDEVGVQVDSDAEKRLFFDVINKRYEEMKPTILISNLALDELTKFTGERVIDRMKENGGIVYAFDWGSYRK